jgi:prepilin-type N-terminal cleavage/methylation domain-containing protein
MVIVRHEQRGVTLVELIVVVAIFGLVSSVLFYNYSDFSTNVSVKNLAQEMALSIRKAQTYATSIRTIDSAQGVRTDRYSGYGMSFALGDPEGGSVISEPSSKSFILFADVPSGGGAYGNGVYEGAGECGVPAPGTECVEGFGINSADKIVRVCTDTGCQESGQVNVLFRRPSPEAEICVVRGGSCQSTKSSFLKVTIQSPKGLEKVVTVWNTGQIGVQ